MGAVNNGEELIENLMKKPCTYFLKVIRTDRK